MCERGVHVRTCTPLSQEDLRVNSCNALYWGYSVPDKVLTKPLYFDKTSMTP